VDLPIAVDGARPIRPDVVFTRIRVAVFVDGCYWHGCPNHHQPSKSNVAYWRTKIARNRERDRRNNQLLANADWMVLRFWEHEDVRETAAIVAAAVRMRRRVTQHKPR
jgi:DNA mismatch endonuclease, patch repair protein